MKVTLNEDQQRAHDEIIAAYREKKVRRYLLTGFAGTGKTTLMQAVVESLQALKANPVVSAPTHKAVQVLRGKLAEAGIEAACSTIHSLLGLKPSATDTEKTTLKRIGKVELGGISAVVIDECSMIGGDLQGYIDNDLMFHFVLYVGDPAQLPPVGEEIAPCLKLIGVEGQHSHLGSIVRQAQGNPILRAAQCLREQQGGAVDWSWLAQVEGSGEAAGTGVFLAGSDASDWMKGAFTSEEFRLNNDAFRYIAYTNECVRKVNAQVRYWIYGETDTPFVSGERVICRNPIMDQMNRPAFSTNEEAVVSSIELGNLSIKFDELTAGPKKQAIPSWSYDLPVWKVKLLRNSVAYVRNVEDGEWDEAPPEVECNMAVDENELKSLDRRLVTEAQANSARWYDRFRFKDALADLRSVYALTAHTSQGSTFDYAFADISDMSKLERRNPLEMQKLLYVAVTRPRYGLILVGAG